MANAFQNRRNRILAVLLALIAAGSLCVMAVSAAGYAISSPAWEALIGFFRARSSGPVAGDPGSGGPDTGGPGDSGDPDTGGPQQPGPNNPGGSGSGDESCLLGLICLRADVDTGGASAGNASHCFLNLLCLSADAAVGNSRGGGAPLIEVDADLDDSGPAAKADVNEDTVIDLDPDVSSGSGTQTLLPGLLGGGSTQDNGCLLGLVCLNLGGD